MENIILDVDIRGKSKESLLEYFSIVTGILSKDYGLEMTGLEVSERSVYGMFNGCAYIEAHIMEALELVDFLYSLPEYYSPGSPLDKFARMIDPSCVTIKPQVDMGRDPIECIAITMLQMSLDTASRFNRDTLIDLRMDAMKASIDELSKIVAVQNHVMDYNAVKFLRTNIETIKTALETMKSPYAEDIEVPKFVIN